MSNRALTVWGFGRATLRSVAGSSVAIVLVGTALAQQGPLNSPSQIIQQYQQAQNNWLSAVFPAAQRLFFLLAVLEVTWTLTLVVLERADFHSLASTLVRKIMWIGIFYALLMSPFVSFGGSGPTFWIRSIIDSFGILGQHAAGTANLSPSGVLTTGSNIAGNLWNAASNAGFFLHPGPAFALTLATFTTFLAYVIITIQYVAALVESYIVIMAGFIFLGFGGSRWTTPYVERYVGLAVSIGIKLMVLYLLIGVGMQLSGQPGPPPTGWMGAAAQVAQSQQPAMTAFDIMGACVIFMALTWMSPKLISSVIGGSPAFSGGDLLSPPIQVAAGGATVGALAFAGVGSLVAAGRVGLSAVREATSFAGKSLSSRGGGGGSGSSGPAALAAGRLPGGVTGTNSTGFLGVGQVPPPRVSPVGGGGGNAGQVAPPGKGGAGQASSAVRSQSVWSRQGSTTSNMSSSTRQLQLPASSGESFGAQGGTAAKADRVLEGTESAARRAAQGLRRVRDDLRKFHISDGGHHPSPPPGLGSNTGSGGSEG
jgi:type IV secretion system protein TrbL